MSTNQAIKIEILQADARFPLGKRGERPVRFHVSRAVVKAAQKWSVPGIECKGTVISAPWHLAPTIAHYLDLELPAPLDTEIPLAGLEHYKQLALHTLRRPYQVAAIEHLTRRAYAILADPPRSGKTLSMIAAAVLVDTKRRIILCPAALKKQWAGEVAQWTNEESIILYGRSSSEARRFCMTCRGRGRVDAPAELVWRLTSAPAPLSMRSAKPKIAGRLPSARKDDVDREAARAVVFAQRAQVAELYQLECAAQHALKVEHEAHAAACAEVDSAGRVKCDACLGRGTTVLHVYRFKAVKREGVEAVEPCPKHGTVGEHRTQCTPCRETFDAALRATSWLIVNFDVLVAQSGERADGTEFVHKHLLGWSEYLANLQRFHGAFDVALIDELHRLRGLNTESMATTKRARAERVAAVVAPIERVWMASATPIYVHTRDIYKPLNILTKGQCENWKGTHFSWMTRYCNGHKDENGYWDDTGETIWAATELKNQLNVLMLKRERHEINPHQPPKIRQVIRLDVEDKEAHEVKRLWAKGVPSKKGAMVKEIIRIGDLKREFIVEDVIDELIASTKEEPVKVMICVFHKESLRRTYDAVIKEREAHGTVGARLRTLDMKVWAISGELGDARTDMAQAFREHPGPAVWVTTIDGSPEGFSLRGAQTVYFADFHWSANAIHQCEMRPFEFDVSGLTVRHYVANGTIDDALEADLLTKIEMLERIVDDSNAANMKGSFLGTRPVTEEEALEAIFARHTAHIREDDDD